MATPSTATRPSDQTPAPEDFTALLAQIGALPAWLRHLHDRIGHHLAQGGPPLQDRALTLLYRHSRQLEDSLCQLPSIFRGTPDGHALAYLDHLAPPIAAPDTDPGIDDEEVAIILEATRGGSELIASLPGLRIAVFHLPFPEAPTRRLSFVQVTTRGRGAQDDGCAATVSLLDGMLQQRGPCDACATAGLSWCPDAHCTRHQGACQSRTLRAAHRIYAALADPAPHE